MRKRISVLLATAASVLLIFALLFTAVQIGINDHTFINNEYTRLGLAKQMGMSNAELVNSCVQLIDYMQGDADSIDIYVTVNGEKTLMFDQAQEVEHMKDVRTLFLTCKQYRDMALLALLVLFLLAAVLTFRDALGTIAKGYVWGAFLMFLIIGFVGTWAALDFSSFWTAFHQALFWNELWLFDPAASRMINMLPEQFFQDLVTRIVLYAGAGILALLVLAIVTLVSLNKRRAKAQEAARQKAAVEPAKRRRKAPRPGMEPKRKPVLTEEERRARIAAKRRREQAAAQGNAAPAQKTRRPAEETAEE